jgi:hypothetical protein
MFPRLRRLFRIESTLAQRDQLRRFCKPQLEGLEDRLVPALSYQGGLLIANVQVEAIYYSPWNTDSTLKSQKSSLDSFFSYLTKSTFVDILAQYSAGGITIGRGSFSGDDTTFPTATTTTVVINNFPRTAIDDSQIRTDISTQINAGSNNLTTPNANTLYFVFTPPVLW